MPIDQINGTTHRIFMPNGDEAEIGDIDSPDFKPTLKLKRWGEECRINLSIPTTEKILPVIREDKILWQGKNYGAEFFQATDGLKMNIILPKKPSTNMFPLDFGSDNLKFFRQPPLTDEFKDGWSEEFRTDIKVTETQVADSNTGKIFIKRPEKVVGSYSVYNATRGIINASKAEAEKYRCGKAFHWYRPLIYDKAGNTTWGILNVDPKAELRTVEIPQDFLDNAVYPVTIDDDFGYKSVGGSELENDNDNILGNVVTGAAGTATSISWYVHYSSYDDGPIEFGLYKQSDQSLIGNTTAISTPAIDDWNEASFDGGDPSVEAIDYIICHWGEEYSINYDSNSDDYYFRLNYSYPGSWPNPGGLTTYGVHRTFSAYVTYTPGGGETYEMSCSDGLSLGETNKATLEIDLALTDGLKGGESTAGQGIFNKLSSDGLSLGDSPLTQAILQELLPDGFDLGDTALVGTTYDEELADGLEFGETVAVSLILNPAAADGLKLGDTASTQVIFIVSTQDGVSLGDSPAIKIILELSLADGFELGDLATLAGAIYSLSVSDGVKLGDIASNIASMSLNIQDGFKLGDITAGSLIINITLTDGVTLGDIAGIFHQYMIAMKVYWPAREIEVGFTDRDIEIRWPDRNIKAGFRDVS